MDSERYFYSIVHESSIHKALETIRTQGAEQCRHLGPEQFDGVLEEIRRIKREELHVVLEGSEYYTDYDIPEGHIVRVCGAYGQICVQGQLASLKSRGIPCEVYRKATIFLKDESGNDAVI